MKAIKVLMLEKEALAKSNKQLGSERSKLKSNQESLMKVYTVLQQQYDTLVPADDSIPIDPNDKEEMKKIQSEMSKIVETIEKAKEKFIQVKKKMLNIIMQC